MTWKRPLSEWGAAPGFGVPWHPLLHNGGPRTCSLCKMVGAKGDVTGEAHVIRKSEGGVAQIPACQVALMGKPQGGTELSWEEWTLGAWDHKDEGSFQGTVTFRRAELDGGRSSLKPAGLSGIGGKGGGGSGGGKNPFLDTSSRCLDVHGWGPGTPGSPNSKAPQGQCRTQPRSEVPGQPEERVREAPSWGAGTPLGHVCTHRNTGRADACPALQPNRTRQAGSGLRVVTSSPGLPSPGSREKRCDPSPEVTGA
ncbi:hypothetical protein P7K49_017207 [Saguinus oedipus]|uniref:Uncharacterized protein n=1 Tax=Saguinus oedipus TaxID=9490 RepID=A0ABQ9V289_SAGOE|nr:hypothetical protein P7K49_017207 [Saguinus oedipus]